MAIEVSKQLVSFPEYAKAQEFRAHGSFSLALPELERVHEVLVHSMGAQTPMALHVLGQMSEAARLGGNMKKAGDLLDSTLPNVSDGPQKVGLVALRSYQHLTGEGGSLAKARTHAEEAVRICETTGGIDPEYFGLSYGLMGASCAVTDNANNATGEAQAEEYLQLAARWSQEPCAELCALNNLAQYHVYCRGAGEGEEGDYRAQIIHGKKLWGTSNEGKKEQEQEQEQQQEEEREGIVEGLSYWEEAVQGFGDDTETRLADDVDYTVAYAGLLSSYSQGLRRSDPARGAELLASALKAIDMHQHDLHARPMLGRILSLIAYNNMAASLAVTAEGLFRSSLDHLSTNLPLANYDKRYLHERALTLGGYSVLTSKWDKREKDADDLRERSQAILGTLEPIPLFIFPDLTTTF
jgi:hypothetical protein